LHGGRRCPDASRHVVVRTSAIFAGAPRAVRESTPDARSLVDAPAESLVLGAAAIRDSDRAAHRLDSVDAGALCCAEQVLGSGIHIVDRAAAVGGVCRRSLSLRAR